MSTVEVLISTYSGENFLAEQLDSLGEQTYQDFIITIRDDGSQDSTMEILEFYQANSSLKINIVNDTQGNLQSSKSFMELLKLSTANYIMFCDQDDVWLPNKIESGFSAMKELEKVYGSHFPLLHFTDLQIVDDNLNEISPSFWGSQKLDPTVSCHWKRLLAQNVVTGCTMIINRHAKDLCFPFALPEMVHDQWIAVNVAKHGYVSYSTETNILYRQHANNVVGAHQNMSKYLLSKMMEWSEIIRFFSRASQHFGEVSWLELIIYKISINIRRIR